MKHKVIYLVYPEAALKSHLLWQLKEVLTLPARLWLLGKDLDRPLQHLPREEMPSMFR